MGSSTKGRPRPTGASAPSSPCSALPRMIASSTSASTATGGFYASFAMPAPEPPYSHNCAGYYSSRGLGKTMVLSAFIVVLLIGASYRGDPSADGPAKRSAPTISFAPSAGPGDINKLNKLTSTTKVGIFSGIDGRDACLLRVVRVPCVLQRVRCQALQGVIQVREAQEEPRGACQANHRRKSFRVARSTWNSLGGFHSQCARQGVPDASSHRDRSG